MEPLSHNDPLHTLLGKARPVEPRPNFTQNVMRVIRQVPQSRSLWERVQGWFSSFSMPRMALAGAAALVAVLVVITLQKPAPESPVVVQPSVMPPQLPAVVDEMLFSATEPADMAGADYTDRDPMGLLLVHEDTSALTDSEIALLLY